MRIRLILTTLFCVSLFANAQEIPKKTLQMVRATETPKIDGVLDDAVWQNAMEAKDFTEFRSTMGQKESDFQKTIVKMTYDDDAIYIGAYLYDKPELIMKQLTSRDNFGQSDFFLVAIKPNNDAQNDT